MSKETKKSRVPPVIIGISDAVSMPTSRPGRGGKSSYDWDALEVGKSIAVANKSARQLTSIITNANKRYAVKSANGTISATKHFFVIDCDPSRDPEGASVRIFRDL